MPARLSAQVVSYVTREGAGHGHHRYANTYLFGQAIPLRYRGRRDGFTWSGVQSCDEKGRVAGLDPAPGNDRAPTPICRATWRAVPATDPGFGVARMYSAAPCTASTATNAHETIGTSCVVRLHPPHHTTTSATSIRGSCRTR